MSVIETKSSNLAIEDEFSPNAPARMILEIAYGRENPADIAERYGYGEKDFETLCKHPPFRKQVEQRVAELKAGGYSFRMKAALAAEDLLEETFKLAMHKSTDFDDKMDALKFFTKVADLEPKNNVPVTAGSGFSITINLADGGMPPKRVVTIDEELAAEDVTAKDTAEKQSDEPDPLPAPEPKLFDIPQMTMDGQPSPGATLLAGSNSDLSGGLPL